MKKYYLIYQITNNINGKIYVGMHETDDLEDDYMGSGVILNHAKQKYGIENFTFKVLTFLQNREEMCLLERCVVTPEFCARDDVYNINEGGDGGWNYVNVSSDYRVGSARRIEQFNSKGGKACQAKYRKYGSFTEYCLKKMDTNDRENLTRLKQIQAKNNFHNDAKFNWRGNHHTSATKQKISEANKLRTPSNFKTHAYYDTATGKKVFIKENERVPATCVSRQEFKRLKGIKTKTDITVEQRREDVERRKQDYIRETQEMADYFSVHGFEETCKKFPGRSGTCSIEAMLMRFINARKRHGITFKSKCERLKPNA